MRRGRYKQEVCTGGRASKEGVVDHVVWKETADTYHMSNPHLQFAYFL